MAEQQHGNHGGNSYGHGSSRPGGGYRGRGGKPSYGRGSGGFHKGGSSDRFHDGERRSGRGGYRGGEGRNDHGDNERGGYRSGQGHGEYRGNEGHGSFRHDDRRGGYRSREDGERRDSGRSGFGGGRSNDFRRNGDNRGGYRGHGSDRDSRGGRDGNGRGGFHRDGERGFGRDDRHDNRRNGSQRDNGRRSYHEGRGFDREDGRGGFRGGDDRRQGGRRDFNRNDRRDGGRDFRHDSRRSNDRNDRRDFRRGDRRNDGRNERRDSRQFDRGGSSRGEGRRDGIDNGRRQFMDRGARRNSDGTMSFPSQNPYTHRRPDEPRMPRGMEWSMLSKDEKERLRGLSKEHAENIGLHILAAYALEESDPQGALDHARWVARQASRVDFARETLAFIAYRQGDYKTALREFKTAQRMNGFDDYTPFIADCERGLGDPKKAVELALAQDSARLSGEAKVELFLVYAGALGDLGLWDKAIDVVRKLAGSNGLPGAYRMRALQAEQYFLEESGRSEEALALDPRIEQLELRYADEDEEDAEVPVIDYDLERLPDDMLEELGISEDDAQYAPEDDDDHADDEEDGATRDEDTSEGEPSNHTVDSDIVSEAEASAANLGVDAPAEGLAREVEQVSGDSDDADDFDDTDETDVPRQEVEQGANANDDPAELTDTDGSNAQDAPVETVPLEVASEPESSLNQQDEEA